MKKPPKKLERPRRGREVGKREEPTTKNENVIYGVNPVLEALRSNARRVERLIVASSANQHRLREILQLAHDAHLRIDHFSPEQIERLVGLKANHQGVAAYASAAEYVPADHILEKVGHDALLLLLDGVEDPRNFGAILRTAECAGVEGVFIPDRRAVGITETVAK